MITANQKMWADWIFYPYITWLLKRHFYSIHLVGDLPDVNRKKPLLLLPNHNSWWDGFIIYLLNKKIINRRIYLMMLEEQLKKNYFFRFLGAYSINPTGPKDVRQSLQYTINLFNCINEPLLVCLFPQGELQPWNARPIIFKRGLDLILNKIQVEIDICFLGMRIEFLGEQRPEIFIQFSSIKKMNKSNYSISEYQSEFNLLLDQLEKKIVNGEKGQMIFKGKKSVNQKL